MITFRACADSDHRDAPSHEDMTVAERRLDSNAENRTKTIITSHIIYLLRDFRLESHRTMLCVDSYQRLIYRCPKHANVTEANCREVNVIEYEQTFFFFSLLLVLSLMAYWPTKPLKLKLNKLYRNRYQCLNSLYFIPLSATFGRFSKSAFHCRMKHLNSYKFNIYMHRFNQLLALFIFSQLIIIHYHYYLSLRRAARTKIVTG